VRFNKPISPLRIPYKGNGVSPLLVGEGPGVRFNKPISPLRIPYKGKGFSPLLVGEGPGVRLISEVKHG